MTGGDALRQLAAQATPGPWRDQGWDGPSYARFILGGGPPFSAPEHMVGAVLPQPAEGDSPTVQADARLIALAPDLAVRYAEAIDALVAVRDWIRDGKGTETDAAEKVDAAIARFADIEARA